MEIEMIPISEVIPYENNPRKNDKAVDVVAKSIKEFGFKVPIILDKNNVIIAGHTRLRAAIQLGLTEVPIIWADELSPKQVKAFRIMDNKSSEFAEWDLDKLKVELDDLKNLNYSLDLTGFEQSALDVLGIESNIGNIPDIDFQGETIQGNPIIIIKLEDIEEANEIWDALKIKRGSKSIEGSKFIEVLNEYRRESKER